MSDPELKCEILETRKQVIKTDNHVAILAQAIKGFERRFDALERSSRLSNVGVYVLIAAVIGVAAFAVTRAQDAALRGEIVSLRDQVAQAREDARAKNDELRQRLAEIEQERERGQEASSVGLRVIKLLQADREREAADALARLRLEHLTELERAIVGTRIADVKQRTAENSYREARRSLDAGRDKAAIDELERSIRLDPDGRFANQARYFLVKALWRHQRFDQLDAHIQILEKLRGEEALLEELRYVRASSLAHSGKKVEAKALFERLDESRFAAQSKAYLAALDKGGELPAIPGSH